MRVAWLRVSLIRLNTGNASDRHEIDLAAVAMGEYLAHLLHRGLKGGADK